jgi:nicotinamidase-related amidase
MDGFREDVHMVLLVIDAQKGITDERLYRFELFVSNVKNLIGSARKNGIEVIFVQHDDGPGSGFSKGDADYEIYEEFAPREDEKIFCKTVNSAFCNTGLKEYLMGKGEKQIVIVGLQTDFCIDASVKAAFEHGFEGIVPEGANSTVDNAYMDKETNYKFYNEFMWPKRYAKCISMTEVLNLFENYAIIGK